MAFHGLNDPTTRSFRAARTSRRHHIPTSTIVFRPPFGPAIHTYDAFKHEMTPTPRPTLEGRKSCMTLSNDLPSFKFWLKKSDFWFPVPTAPCLHKFHLDLHMPPGNRIIINKAKHDYQPSGFGHSHSDYAQANRFLHGLSGRTNFTGLWTIVVGQMFPRGKLEVPAWAILLTSS